MLSRGDTAPTFELPGTGHASHVVYRLEDALGPEGVLVVFAPCTELTAPRSMVALAPWFQFLNETRVCIVTDRRLSAAGESLPDSFQSVPVVVDPDQSVAEQYGVQFEELDGQMAFLIEADRRVALADQLDFRTVKRLPERLERVGSRPRMTQN